MTVWINYCYQAQYSWRAWYVQTSANEDCCSITAANKIAHNIKVANNRIQNSQQLNPTGSKIITTNENACNITTVIDCIHLVVIEETYATWRIPSMHQQFNQITIAKMGFGQW